MNAIGSRFIPYRTEVNSDAERHLCTIAVVFVPFPYFLIIILRYFLLSTRTHVYLCLVSCPCARSHSGERTETAPIGWPRLRKPPKRGPRVSHQSNRIITWNHAEFWIISNFGWLCRQFGRRTDFRLRLGSVSRWLIKIHRNRMICLR